MPEYKTGIDPFASHPAQDFARHYLGRDAVVRLPSENSGSAIDALAYPLRKSGESTLSARQGGPPA